MSKKHRPIEAPVRMPIAGPPPVAVEVSGSLDSDGVYEITSVRHTEPPGAPFLALGTIKIGPSWHVIELDCERFDSDEVDPELSAAGEVRVIRTRLSNAATRARAIAEFKMTAARKKVIA